MPLSSPKRQIRSDFPWYLHPPCACFKAFFKRKWGIIVHRICTILEGCEMVVGFLYHQLGPSPAPHGMPLVSAIHKTSNVQLSPTVPLVHYLYRFILGISPEPRLYGARRRGCLSAYLLPHTLPLIYLLETPLREDFKSSRTTNSERFPGPWFRQQLWRSTHRICRPFGSRIRIESHPLANAASCS